MPNAKCSNTSKYHKRTNPCRLAGIRLLFTHDTTLRVLKEFDDVLNLRTVGHLVTDLVYHVKHARLSVEEQTIGVGNVVLNLLVNPGKVEHRGVGPAILHRITTGNDIRRNVVREGRTSLDQREVTGTGVGILDGSAGEDDAISDLTVACDLRAITKHTVRSHRHVVTDVGSFEQVVVVADLRHTATVGTTVDDDILSDDVVITNLHIRLGTTEVKVLRQGGDDRTLMDLVTVADARAAADGNEGEDDAVVTDLHVVLNIHEWEYLTVIADLRLWTYLGFRGNFTCHTIYFFGHKFICLF